MTGALNRHPRVLLVEDQLLLGMSIANLLEDVGCEVVGPFAHVTTALAVALREPLDAAILDVYLADQSVEPIARVLDRRHIPFAVVSAYPRQTMPPSLQARPFLGKPFMDMEIKSLVSGLVNLH